jgi:hypothetical protein
MVDELTNLWKDWSLLAEDLEGTGIVVKKPTVGVW